MVHCTLTRAYYHLIMKLISELCFTSPILPHSDASGVHTLSITGSGFSSADVNDYSVTIGEFDCEVQSVSATSVSGSCWGIVQYRTYDRTYRCES